jgi:hypothetical protein
MGNNIKMDLNGTGYEIFDGIYLARDIYQLRVVLKTAM